VTLDPRTIAIHGLGEDARFVALQGLVSFAELVEVDDDSCVYAHRRRGWRPGELEPLAVLPPRKRPRRRRREELLLIGP
jgi:hypothetical protein